MVKRLSFIFVLLIIGSLLFVSADSFGYDSGAGGVLIRTYNNYSINGTTLPHNDLASIQGGGAGEYYHLTNNAYSSVNTYYSYFSTFYNSTDFDIADYYTSAQVNSINTSMKNYVDWVNSTNVGVSYNDAWINGTILSNNQSVQNYILYVNSTNSGLDTDTFVANYSTFLTNNVSLNNYINDTNISMKNYVLWVNSTTSGGSGVPYDGATGNVNLGVYNLTLNNITGESAMFKGIYGDPDMLFGFPNVRLSTDGHIAGRISFEYENLGTNTIWQIDNGGDSLRFFNATIVHARLNTSGFYSLFDVCSLNGGVCLNSLNSLVGANNISMKNYVDWVNSTNGGVSYNATWINETILVNNQSLQNYILYVNSTNTGTDTDTFVANYSTFLTNNLSLNNYIVSYVGIQNTSLANYILYVNSTNTGLDTDTFVANYSTFLNNNVSMKNYVDWVNSTNVGGDNITGAGTTNYVSKWTSSTVLGNSVIYDDGTNVGIGTTNPTALLNVGGTGSENNLRLQGTSGYFQMFTASGLTEQNIRPISTAIGDIKWTHEGVADRWAIGIKASSDAKLYFTSGGSVGSGTDRMVIDSNGNVGIGTTAPSYLLDVAGNVNAYSLKVNGTDFNTTRNNYVAFVNTSMKNYVDWVNATNGGVSYNDAWINQTIGTNITNTNTSMTNWISNVFNVTRDNYIGVVNTSMLNYVGVQNTSIINWVSNTYNTTISNYIAVQNTSLKNYADSLNTSVTNTLATKLNLAGGIMTGNISLSTSAVRLTNGTANTAVIYHNGTGWVIKG